MGCSSSRPSDLPKPNAPLAAADVPPPFPFGHHLLVGLVRSLDLEHGPANEPGAVATWVTLELECRPTKDLVELNTDLKTCCDFVATIEKAIKEKAVTIDQLRERWGCPPSEFNLPKTPDGPVTLADVSMSAGGFQLRDDRGGGGMNGDSDDEHFDDVDSIDANDDERYGGATMESRMGGDEPTPPDA